MRRSIFKILAFFLALLKISSYCTTVLPQLRGGRFLGLFVVGLESVSENSVFYYSYYYGYLCGQFALLRY
jgi:hypothetical protein